LGAGGEVDSARNERLGRSALEVTRGIDGFDKGRAEEVFGLHILAANIRGKAFARQ
jgi:hypothetical protein